MPPRQDVKATAGVGAGLTLVLLLVAPGIALGRRVEALDDLWIPLGVLTAVSLFTYFAYRSDKARATRGEWRIPESTLHLCELFGGWPGAFIAQHQVRHKVSKVSYQIVFWMIVLLHQFLAVDSLNGWTWTRQGIAFVKAQFS